MATTAAPVAVIFLIMTYSKVTHFYTLILGFSMFLIAAVLVTYGMIFADAASLLVYRRCGDHHAVQPGRSLPDSVCALPEHDRRRADPAGDAWRFLRSGLLRTGWPVRNWMRYLAPTDDLCGSAQAIMGSTFTRAIMAMVVLGVFALLPYGLFVKFVALRGVPNLSETVPGDFYFITDASISCDHLLALDMAGIMDKMMTGDYLAKEPRYANIFYTAHDRCLPLFLPAMRRRIFDTHACRQFLFMAYLNVFFSMWATLGYSEPGWLPTFHRTIALISRAGLWHAVLDRRPRLDDHQHHRPGAAFSAPLRADPVHDGLHTDADQPGVVRAMAAQRGWHAARREPQMAR